MQPGFTWLYWCHYLDVVDSILQVDRIRPRCLSVYCYSNCSECHSTCHQYWKNSVLRCRPSHWYQDIQQALSKVCIQTISYEYNPTHSLFQLSSIEGLASYMSPCFWLKDTSTLIGSICIQLCPSASSVDSTGWHSDKRLTYANVDCVIKQVDSLLWSKISGLEELMIQP